VSISPHGGVLIDRFTKDPASLESEAAHLPKNQLLTRELSDLLLIAEGGLSPLGEFMTRDQVDSVLARGRLPGGLAWTIPITLQAKDLEAKPKDRIALVDASDRVRAILTVEERFTIDLGEAAQRIYGTRDPAHPGVAVLLGEDPVRLAGPVEVLPLAPAEHRRSAREIRAEIDARGWREVVAFQTRNPLHRSHEYLLRIALEVHDGLLLHPLVGETKKDDVPADVRMACYRALVEHYLPKPRVILATLDAAMRYAGPAEAIHHAIMRQNFGASRFIVGRDHAGVGKYYGPFDAQARFDQYSSAELAIRPLKLDITFYCTRCGGPASPRTCAHDPSARIELSGSEVRRRLAHGEALPPEFSRPEVAEILRGYYQALEREERAARA
jgi:sulfate adenylyltransferase